MPVKVCVARVAVSRSGRLATYGIVVEAGIRCGRELIVGKLHKEGGVVSTCSCRDPMRKALLRAMEAAKELRCRSLKILVEAETMPQGILDDLRRYDHFTYLTIQRVPQGDATLLADDALERLHITFPELSCTTHISSDEN